MIDGLRPAALDHGLAPALHGLVGRFGEGAGAPTVTLVVDGDLTELPAAVEVVAYRVVTEALTNVVKHARAGTVQVEVHRDERHLDLRIVDDGVGPDARQLGGGDRRRPVVDAGTGRGAGRAVHDRPGRPARHPGRAAAARRRLT